MVLPIITLLIGMALLIKGADIFIEAAVRIAEKHKISEFTIGLTLVSVGTSLPELAASGFASYTGSPGLAVGNVVGSNIANIGLILGLSALVSRVKGNEDILKRDGSIMIFASVLAYAFLIDGMVSRGEGFFLFLFFIAYTVFLFEEPPHYYGLRAFIIYFFKLEYVRSIHKKNLMSQGTAEKISGHTKDILLVVVGLLGVVLGADLTVKGAVGVASSLGVSETIIGLTLISLGTSLPELVVSFSAAQKKRSGILIGNILGSNISNIFLILGVSSMIGPLPASSLTIYYGIPVMLFISALLLYFLKTNRELTKKEGVTLFNIYILFQVGLLAYSFF